MTIEVISYKILSPSKMEITQGERRMIVSGEIALGPVFYADIRAMKAWEEPHAQEVISEGLRSEIIDTVILRGHEHGLKIVFD